MYTSIKQKFLLQQLQYDGRRVVDIANCYINYNIMSVRKQGFLNVAAIAVFDCKDAFFNSLLIALGRFLVYAYSGANLHEQHVVSWRKDRMDTRTVLIILLAATLVIIVGLFILFGSRGRRDFDRSVDATISQIKVEASTMSSWWVIIAQWSDPRSGQTLTFRSPRLKRPPKQHVGERITVEFDARQPKRYRMDLDII